MPERIAKLTVETAATSIAAGGGYLFWTSEDGGHLRKVAAAGGPPEMFVDGQAQPLGIAVNATTVFWAAEGSQQVSQASIADPGSTQLTTMTVGSPLAVAVRGQQLAWSEYGEPDNGAVMSSNNMQMTTVLAQGTGLVRHLAVGTPAVFWITADGATLVQSLPAQPGFESLATEIGLGDDMANAGLAAGEAAVFWTVPTGGEPPHRNSVYRFTLGGDTAPDAIATAQSDPRGIALSGATVVWANCGTGQTDGTIMQKDANNPVVELAAGLDCPDRVAIGDDNVYWMANNGTEIWKLPL